MWPALFRNSALPAVEQTVQFAERRHALLAGNVANADTPGYQTRDLSVDNFQSALKDAMKASHATARNPLSAKTSGYDGLSHAQATENVRESMKQILFHDGSDVGLETQVTEIAKNQSMHSTAMAILRNQYHLLQMAISESVNV
ncbi:MAG: flagellar basal body rod protein FlgB [Pirellulaceae bacterium]|nr:flagellar basal body rod protein FlgB [Pirellulaceae bacterium]